jgi:tetratricopeptide (TPR) repeat protein
MYQYENCPRCGTALNSDRFMGGTIVCECGWTKSLKSAKLDHQNVDRTCASIIVIAGVLIACFLQAVNWDRHFFTIIPLKVKHIAGFAGADDLESIASICVERKKHECVEKAYNDIARIAPTNLKNLSRLGILQYKRQRYAQAAEVFSRYFSQKGTDLESAYDFALSLAHLKRYSDSEKYFRFALKQKDDVLQITVVRSYIQMLMESGNLRHAKDVLVNYRKQSSSANMFMSKEFNEIRTRLGEIVTTASTK